MLPQKVGLSGVRRQHLHRDGAVQPRVMGTEYNAHAAAAELSFNSVAVGYEIAHHEWRKGQAQLYTNRYSVEEPGDHAFSLPSVKGFANSFSDAGGVGGVANVPRLAAARIRVWPLSEWRVIQEQRGNTT